MNAFFFSVPRSQQMFAFCCLLALPLTCCYGPASALADEANHDGRLFELRTYTANEGKLDALHRRFQDHTIRLFKKHGMDVIAFWTPTDDERSQNTLVYILAYPDLAARKKAWAAFLADPEWQKAYAESIQGGRLVKKIDSVFLRPTAYSPLK